MANIVITGGSGLVGKRLTTLLKERGHNVSHLSRTAGEKDGVKAWRWDYKTGEIDVEALKNADYIINVAGANVADKRWTLAFKKELYGSRVFSTRLLFNAVKQHNIPIKKVISASAVGYYENSDKRVTELSPAGSEFLSKVCKDWEAEAKRFTEIHIPQTIVRIGIVLSPDGGFAQEMAGPIKKGFGAVLGSGRQLISWIHIDDLCGIFIRAIEEPGFTGTYNGVSPQPLTNAEMTKALAKILKKPLWLPKAPAFALKLLFGGFSYELLVSHNVSADKLLKSGFKFQFTDINEALNDVLEHEK